MRDRFLPTVNQNCENNFFDATESIIVNCLFVIFERISRHCLTEFSFLIFIIRIHNHCKNEDGWNRRKIKTKRDYLIGANMAAVVRLVSNRVYSTYYIIYFFFSCIHGGERRHTHTHECSSTGFFIFIFHRLARGLKRLTVCKRANVLVTELRWNSYVLRWCTRKPKSLCVCVRAWSGIKCACTAAIIETVILQAWILRKYADNWIGDMTRTEDRTTSIADLIGY